MAQSIECQSCGNIYYDDSEKCPYCGSVNQRFNSSKQSNDTTNSLKSTYDKIVGQDSSSNNHFNNQARTETSSKINVCLLIVLLIVFWPAGLVYLIVKLVNKN